MKKILATIICMAILTAIPLGAVAQVMEPSPEDPVIDPYWYYWPQPGGFNYSDGVANGTYVDFLLNETTGTISDYTTRLVDYNFYYPMMYYEGMREDAPGADAGYMPEPTDYTINLFDTVEFEGFAPNGSPGVFGQSLVFLGQNVMMTFDDYEGGSMRFQFGNENDTVTFTVPDGIEVTQTPHYYALYDIPPEEIGMDYDYGIEEGDTASYDSDFGVYYDPWRWTWDQVWLRSGNISCSIWVDRGTVNVTGNSIVIETYPGAHVSTSTWIEYGWQYRHSEPWFTEDVPDDERGAMAGAMDSGLVAAVGYLFAGESGHHTDSKTMNDPSFKLEFKNVEENRFQVEVQSEIKNGRIVTLNVNKDALDADGMKDIRVLLDDHKIRGCGSMEDLVDLQGGTKAGYYMVSGNSQSTIFVYVPSFSTHVITVGLAEGIGGVLLPIGLAAGFMVVAVALVVNRGRRNKDQL